MTKNTILDGTTYIPDSWLEPVCHPNSANALLRFCGFSATYVGPDNKLISLLDLHEMLTKHDIPPTAKLAFDFAETMEPSYHGLVGQAVIASNTLREAIEIFVKYKPTRNRLFEYQWSIENNHGVLFFQPRVDLGVYKTLHLISIFHTSYKILEFILGRTDANQVGLCYSKDMRGLEVFGDRFQLGKQQIEGKQGLGLIIPVSALDKRNPMADAKQLKAARRSLEEELHNIEGHLTEKVRSLIYTLKDNRVNKSQEYEWRSLQDIAELLHLSRSSLIRGLKTEGNQYSTILDESRHHLACWYLVETKISVAEIAFLLGYKDSSNLGRTFKKWTHETPAKYRKKHKKDES